ncbi:MAG TPA: Gfo/Idh/MocA family oxidoreductase [Actinomycetota bacterium]|nr:Gfo/Idh/MocA family oxidoreductase [Actinomycetota bacterium]
MSGDMLRWGVLSTAKIGIEKVIPATIAAARCGVVAIASRDLGRAQAAASGLGVARAFGSYEDLVADPDVDAVYNPLPNHLHAEWTIAAARAGKHVLCEKPLATSAAEAERMIQVCEAEGVLLMEAFMYRLHPTWEAVRASVASGRIGELTTVQSWFSYFNDDPNDIRNQVETGGGALYDIGCYCVNLSRMLFGAEPIRIQGSVSRDAVLGIDTLTSGILGFDDGIASFTCSTRAEPDQRVHIYGTGGRISLEIPFNIPWDRPTRVFVTAGGEPPVRPETEVLTFDPANEYSIQAERFAAAALDGVPVPIPAYDAVGNLRVIEELFRVG